MSSLFSPTDPRWAAFALAHADELLLDHAHCEKKAAATARSLLRRYPEHAFLRPFLERLVREELSHLAVVRRQLASRGVPFRRLRPGPYAARLLAGARSFEPARLLDTLLCCALIEARSAERFSLLARETDDPELASLYRGLLAAEARHHRGVLALARRLDSADAVRERLGALAQHEARVLAEAPALPRMHGGVPS